MHIARRSLIDASLVCDENGCRTDPQLRHGMPPRSALTYHNGEDLRREPIEDRKLALNKLLGQSHPGIAYNRHFNVEGAIVFKNACRLGCEGIVSKLLGSPYRSGRSADWIKVKNPAAPAMKREAAEEWR